MYNLARTCVKSRFPRLGAPILPLDGFLHDNAAYHSRTKHIQRRYHWIRERVEKREFVLTKIHTSKNGSDILTKVLTPDKLEACRKQIGLARHPMFELIFFVVYSLSHIIYHHSMCFNLLLYFRSADCVLYVPHKVSHIFVYMVSQHER